jgi:primosomal protein N' (replication factor Y) (superfamily II helicase)
LVRFRFHGKLTRGWILGPTDDVPERILAVQRLVSPVRFFDADLLGLAGWVAERYVAPLAAVLHQMAPPRVAELERSWTQRAATPAPSPKAPPPPAGGLLPSYRRGSEISTALARRLGGAFVLRPAPEHEVALAVEVVAACLAAGRRALVLVPEADPVPATARAVADTFGPRARLFLGGDRRERFRMWLDIADGGADVVVGTRPAVFAPLRDLGAIVVSRESHAAHREDRAPYFHARDVALQRAQRAGAVCVVSALCPSSEVVALGLPEVVSAEKRWPPVEVVRPGPEGRAPRLVQALRHASRSFVYSPLPGYGVAAVCRSCGEPAACAVCGGLLRQQSGEVRCTVCRAPGRCAVCGAATFGIRRGGAERVTEWVARRTDRPVRRPDIPRLPDPSGETLIGGPESVRDLGPGGLDLVAILDADLAARRPGLSARERALATWMEAVGWARPDGRAIVQASEPSDPAVQALVRGNPRRFHALELERRSGAGFPVGARVFRVVGSHTLAAAIEAHRPITSLVSTLGDRTVCLLALEAGDVPAFGASMRELAARGVVERVEAEPHL